MDNCRECQTKITDATNYNGWCKACYEIEQQKYRRFCARQDGLDLLTDAELNLLEE